MRVWRIGIEALLVAAALLAAAASGSGSASATTPPTPAPAATPAAAVAPAKTALPAPPKGTIRLPDEAHAGLPAAIACEKQAAAPGQARAARKGAQVFQSKAGVYATFELAARPETCGRLCFPTAGPWLPLPDRRFAGSDVAGNRLILGDGSAEIILRSGPQVGAYRGPALGALYRALLKATK